jgi:hypothetical protein
MFEKGSLIYIDDFDFTSINPSFNGANRYRNKYVLIFENNQNVTVFGCFLTSYSEFALLHRTSKPGCNPKIYTHHIYRFDNSQSICDKVKFNFPVATYVGGVRGQFHDFDLPALYQDYKISGHIKKIGSVKEEILYAIAECLHPSEHLEEDYGAKLFEFADKIYSTKQQSEYIKIIEKENDTAKKTA